MASHVTRRPCSGSWSSRAGWSPRCRGTSASRRGHHLGRSATTRIASLRDPLPLRTEIVDIPGAWRRELLLVGVLYVAYAASRLASPVPAGASLTNGRRVLDFERRLHIAPEHTLNDLLYDAPRWLSIASAYFYETMHYAVTVAMLVWLYRANGIAYRRARNWLVAMTFPALIVFWAFPVSPPRSTPGAVAQDIVAEQHQYGWWGAGGGTAPSGLGGLVNDHAAMPSLHVGWALWAGWNLVHSARNRYVRALGCVYPFITIVVVLSTGNHYLVDVLAGVALALLAKAAVGRLMARARRRPDASIGVVALQLVTMVEAQCTRRAHTARRGTTIRHLDRARAAPRQAGLRGDEYPRVERAREASTSSRGGEANADPTPDRTSSTCDLGRGR